MQFT